MSAFETKVPAPLVALIAGAGMFAYARVTYLSGNDSELRIALAVALAQVSAFIALAAFAAFWRHRTTLDPFRPQRARALVTRGIFRFSRNPMYLSLLLLLAAYAVRLGAWASWAGPLAFGLYVTRYQIVPEERALEDLFGDSYRAYKRQTRRWL
jgi:protein-S-isoprenylcysteine O-methyltransferase Ste14